MTLLFKIIGIVMIIAAASLCGNNMALRLYKRAEALKQAAQLCTEMGERIRYFATPVEQIINELSVKYERLSFLQNYPDISPQYPFTKTDAKVIKDFFSGLGAGDVCGQLKYCEAYALQLERLADGAKSDCDSKNRLYRVLGFFCGICISVLLI